MLLNKWTAMIIILIIGIGYGLIKLRYNATSTTPRSDLISPGPAIEMAILKQEKFNKIKESAEKFGIICQTSAVIECEQLTKRAENNENLAKALKEAKSNNISIFAASDKGKVGIGWISIDINWSDDDIIYQLVRCRVPNKYCEEE